jgi:hypothetical protein
MPAVDSSPIGFCRSLSSVGTGKLVGVDLLRLPNTTPLSFPEVLHAMMPVIQESPCFPGFPWDLMDANPNTWHFG